MLSVGVDLGKRNSQVSTRNEEGVEVANVRIATTAEGIKKVFGGLTRARVLMEASTPARWVSKLVSELKHEVVIADPNYLPMYVDAKSKRKKTDKRDASLLSEALHKGNYRLAHLRSEVEQERKTLVETRGRLVATRTRHINAVRALMAQWGHAVPSCTPEHFPAKVQPFMKELSAGLKQCAQGDLKMIRHLNTQVRAMDRELEREARKNPVLKRLMTAPGVGAVTASAIASTIDDPQRFANGHELGSFLGLVPREHSSGEQRVLGRITKAGPTYLRALLVQASWAIIRSKEPESMRLRQWAEQISERRGKRVAVIALARKLSGILLAMWKNQKDFDAEWSSQKQQEMKRKVKKSKAAA